jgi:phenylacetic acid degradation operon negative regulatory protein
MGDYWWDDLDAFVPASVLVVLLGEFGVRPDAARTALSRLRRSGMLEARRNGRWTAYRIAPDRRGRAAVLGRALMGFGDRPVAWDGGLTCVAFSVPESTRARRPALRNRLRALGFGALHDGVWVTPHDRAAAAGRVLDDLGVDDATVMRVAAVGRAPAGGLAGAWDLAPLRAGYHELVTSLAALRPRLDAGAVGDAEALVVRTELLDRWRSLVSVDPALPAELLPDGWPLPAARAAFVAAYDALGPLGERRVRQLVDTVLDGAAGGAGSPPPTPPRYHRVGDVV